MFDNILYSLNFHLIIYFSIIFWLLWEINYNIKFLNLFFFKNLVINTDLIIHKNLIFILGS